MSRRVMGFDGLGNFFMHVCPIDGKFRDGFKQPHMTN